MPFNIAHNTAVICAEAGIKPEGSMIVAVSGGSDSTALLVKAVSAGLPVVAVTIDHGLRPEAAQEAADVGALCRKLQIPHIVRQAGLPLGSRVQERARHARYNLLAEAAREHNAGMVLVGHTADDLAETLVQRLHRRTGTPGLIGIPPVSFYGGIAFVRPLLTSLRADLRSFLQALAYTWVDDPGNARSERGRIRAGGALPITQLCELAQQAYAWRTLVAREGAAFITRHVRPHGHDAVALPRDLAPYAPLAFLLHRVGGMRYAPPVPSNFNGSVAGGCVLRSKHGQLMIAPEQRRGVQRAATEQPYPACDKPLYLAAAAVGMPGLYSEAILI